jgi:hypothetical protein
MEAATLLRPNVLMSRSFSNVVTGQRASVLFVQCDDSRNLTSHYPPICYTTSAGMEQVSARPRQWIVEGLTIPGTEYEFRSGYFGGSDSIVVLNFILLPSGEIAKDMEPVKRRQMSVRNRYYGAGQVQLVFNAAVPAEARDQAFGELVAAYRPLIDAVLSGRGDASERP